MKEAIKIKMIILLGILTVMLLSCSDKLEQELNAAKSELAYTQMTRDSVEASMIASLDEIDKRIGIIRSQKGYLVFGNESDVKNKKDQILNNIALMDELIGENEKRIGKLRGELKRVNSNNKELNKRIARYEDLNKEIALEIDGLRKQVMEAKEQNEKLAGENEKLNIELSNQNVIYENLHAQYSKAEKDAYTGYCVTGTRKELKKAKVIEKQNILSAEKLNPNAAPENFEKLDTRTTLQIPIGTKEAKIVTIHDQNSYKWCDEEDGKKRLCIVDPQTFWEKSKYLVIETK